MPQAHAATERIRLFWQPGCTSCLRTKEFLNARAVAYDSINVAAEPAGWDALAELGIRTVPVVARGKEFVFGQVLGEVAEFLDLDPVGGPELTPDQLVDRLQLVLETAARLTRQVPDARRDDQWPGRPRSIRELAYHIFNIPEQFLACIQTGETLDDEALNALPPPSLENMVDVAAFGDTIGGRVRNWWQSEGDRITNRELSTYFGPQSLHVVIERTTWHSAQHTRQIAVMLDSFGITPDRPLGETELQGLPLPENVWDG